MEEDMEAMLDICDAIDDMSIDMDDIDIDIDSIAFWVFLRYYG